MKLRWSLITLAFFFHTALAVFPKRQPFPSIKTFFNKADSASFGPLLPLESSASVNTPSSKSNPSNSSVTSGSTTTKNATTSALSTSPTSTSVVSKDSYSPTVSLPLLSSIVTAPNTLSTQNSNGMPIGIIAVVVAFSLLAIISLVMGIVFWRRRVRDVDTENFDILASTSSARSQINTSPTPYNHSRRSSTDNNQPGPGQEMVVIAPPVPAQLDSWDRYLMELQNVKGVQ